MMMVPHNDDDMIRLVGNPFSSTIPAVTAEPRHGWTSQGEAVHGKTVDHHKADTAYDRFNKRVAVWLTQNVGSMTAFWIFTLASMTVAPSCLFAAGYIHWKSFLTTFGFELLATLILSTWLELALMPAIMVGQNLQNEANDTRSAKQFEDTEKLVDGTNNIINQLDLHTQGGLTDIMDELKSIRQLIQAIDQKTP